MASSSDPPQVSLRRMAVVLTGPPPEIEALPNAIIGLRDCVFRQFDADVYVSVCTSEASRAFCDAIFNECKEQRHHGLGGEPRNFKLASVHMLNDWGDVTPSLLGDGNSGQEELFRWAVGIRHCTESILRKGASDYDGVLLLRARAMASMCKLSLQFPIGIPPEGFFLAKGSGSQGHLSSAILIVASAEQLNGVVKDMTDPTCLRNILNNAHQFSSMSDDPLAAGIMASIRNRNHNIYGFDLPTDFPAHSSLSTEQEPASSCNEEVDVLSTTYRQQVYEGVIPDARFNFHGWKNAGFEEYLRRGIEHVSLSSPSKVVVIELGTWMGMSTNLIAKAIKQAGLDGSVIAIDTWLGSSEHYTTMTEECIPFLNRKNCFPRLYFTFLKATVFLGNHDVIVPLALPTQQAASVLEFQKVQADMMYIDAAHDEPSVYTDVASYWKLLKPGGYMFGDDWEWEGVRDAVTRFSQEQRVDLQHSGGVWSMIKPVA